MNVVINGQARELSEGTSVAAALAEMDIPERGVAVAVDGELVPRAGWADMPLRPGVTVEVLTAVQGG